MLHLIRKYPQLIIFGILAAAFSGPGQTFLVSLFIPGMREAFGYNQTEISGLYAAATVCSALLLPLIGHLLDRTDLLKFTLIVGLILTGGCLILSQSVGWLTVFLGFLLVRNMGQGTMTLISSTTMARIFGPLRGKALGIANLGYPLGEAIFPFLVVSWILHYGWRSGWIFLAILMVVFFSPAVFYLLRRDPQARAMEEMQARDLIEKKAEQAVREVTDWSLKGVIRDWRFYVLQVPAIIPACFITALLFHQGSLMEWKGWDLRIIAAGFVGFALGRGVFSLLIGPLIDRYSARRLYPIYLFPFGLGLVFLIVGQPIVWGFLYLLGIGITIGMGMTLGGALWAELYGTTHLGSIRGFQSSLVVLSTAIAPLALGIFLDKGGDPSHVLWGLVGFVILGSFLAWVACRKGRESLVVDR